MKLHLWPKHYNHTLNRAKSVSYTSSHFSPYMGALELQFSLGPFYTFVSLSLMVLYQLESIHLDNYNLIYSQNKNRGFTEILTAFPLLYNMILMPSIQIVLFSNQCQCIIPQFHKSLTNCNISYTIQHQTLTIHSLDFSNPNLIHFFLNFFQRHHHSTLNTTNLTSFQENQGIRYKNHKNPAFPPLETYLFLAFLGSSLLIPLVDHLKSLNEEKNHLSYLSPTHFLLLSPFFPFFSLFSSLFFSNGRAPLFLSKLNLLNLDFASHFQNCP